MSNDVKLTKLADCAGCGAKVGAGELAKLLSDIKVHEDPNLLVGFDKADDAAVYKVTDEIALVETIDFFPPIADDPYTYGAIAATNALSDVYAMGGEPKVALNVMAVSEDMPSHVVHEILRGGYDKVYEAGANIVGGHSIYDNEPKYGLAVSGFVNPKKMYTNSGARADDVLILTKALGVGVLTTAAKADMLSIEEISVAEASMMTLNRYARDIMVNYDVHAVTDVTGFSLMGHLLEMCQGSGLLAKIIVNDIKILSTKVFELARLGILPAGMYRNRRYAEKYVQADGVSREMSDVLFCPETSGGLLISVARNDAQHLLAALQANEHTANSCVVGYMEKQDIKNKDATYIVLQ